MRLYRLALAGTVILALTGLAASPAQAAKKASVPILLVAAGGQTEISPIPGTNSYRLRMQDTEDLITWFSDRPARKSGLMLAHDLVEKWSKIGFTAVPPNSALVLRDPGSTRTLTVEVRSPRYEGGVLAFTIRPLEKLAQPLPTSASMSSLFIDDASVVIPPNSGAWNFQSVVVQDPTNAYLAKLKIQNSATTDSSFIYSIPASALISNYTDTHLNLPGNGIKLYGGATSTG
jgi:hypothetical protein